MKFSLSDINPKFLAANAEALRAQGVDVSKGGKLSENGVLDSVLVMAEKKGRKTLAESRLKIADGKGLPETFGQMKPDETVKYIFHDEVAHWPGESVNFTIPGPCIGKPRMTQRDRWAKRPAVLRYRDWCDHARDCAPRNLTKEPLRLVLLAWMPMPESWSKKKKAAMAGQHHRARPDGDNICKSAMDALWEEDSSIAELSITKRWEDEKGPRLEVEVFTQ